MVDPSNGELTGVVDLDTLGIGDELTDRASLLAQLSSWPTSTNSSLPHGARSRQCGDAGLVRNGWPCAPQP